MLRSDEVNRRYFREAYSSGEHGWETQKPNRYALALLRRVRKQVPGGTLLDIGCGEGRHCIAARRLGFKVTGIDYEPRALKRARNLARTMRVRGIKFREADVFWLPFAASCSQSSMPGRYRRSSGRRRPDCAKERDPQSGCTCPRVAAATDPARARSVSSAARVPHGWMRECFDVVLDYGCLHHQKKSDWAAYRESVLRLLKSRGFYLLSVFSPRFRFFAGGRRRWHIAYGAYRRCFTIEEIRALFERHFEFIAIEEERGEGRGFWHVLMQRRASGQPRHGKGQRCGSGTP